MGCGTSTEVEPSSPEIGGGKQTINTYSKPIGSNETILSAYQKFDESICRMESLCPGPRLATAEAWVEHLESMGTKSIVEDMSESSILNETKDGLDEDLLNNSLNDDTTTNKEQNDLAKVRRLATQLGVAFDVTNATKHEEFIAKISRNVMIVSAVQLRNEMIEHSRKRVVSLLKTYNNLRQIYVEQDNLISVVTGGTYSSPIEERLDIELENSRQIRDKLGSVAEQWRTSGALLRACAKGALQAVECWNLVGTSRIAEERISLALDTRNAILGSLVAFEGAQISLPQVEVPFVSPRQATAIRHANIYLLTDIANDQRYQHTKDVISSFQSNTTKAMEWLHETYKNSLKKDLDDSDNVVIGLAKQLRDERMKYIKDTVGSQIYVPPVGVSDS